MAEPLKQPKPDSKKYTDLISEIKKGSMKIPKFQRDFVWSIEKTAQLLDSILKGYPIGTFILWETDERINNIKDIGDLTLPDTPDGQKVQYILDGQQRITSLYAAFAGAQIRKVGEKKITDYSEIYVDLGLDVDSDEQIVASEKPAGAYVTLNEILTSKSRHLGGKYNLSEDEMDKIDLYDDAFKGYDFSIVLLRKEDIDSAIEVFTRINTGGQTLTLFEIMSAKTYDETLKFDMQEKWDDFLKDLESRTGYEDISSSVVLQLLAIIISTNKECTRKTILRLEKQKIIDHWTSAIKALELAIDYFRDVYKVPVSQLLPYDSLLVPFGYFFHTTNDSCTTTQAKKLEEFFWRMSLSERYSSTVPTRLAQDIRRIDSIIANEQPAYDDIKIYYLDSFEELIDVNFSAGSSYCKAILCLLASETPKDFQNNKEVRLDNSWLQRANSKNYHHFFPKAYLRKAKIGNENSMMNITLVSEKLNKREIGSKSPSEYISKFAQDNPTISTALNSHLIDLNGFGIKDNDYELFLQERAKKVYAKLKKKISP